MLNTEYSNKTQDVRRQWIYGATIKRKKGTHEILARRLG